MNSNWSYSPETPNSGQNWWFLSRVTLKFDRWPLKNNRAPLLCYFKLCASFRSHLWIQTGVTVRKLPSQIKISDFLSHVTLKFDGWPWKRIGQLFYRYYFKLCASFHSHQWIHEVTIRKYPIWVQICNFLSRAILKFDGWPWNTIGHLFYTSSSLIHHFIAICEFKLELQLGNTQNWDKICFDLCELDIWPLTLTLILHGYHICHYITPENFRMIWWWEHSEGVTDRQTDSRSRTSGHYLWATYQLRP